MEKTAPTVDRLLTRPEVAQMARISVSSLDRLASAGKTPAPVRVGAGTVRFRLSDIQRWIAEGCPDRATFEARKGGL